MGVSGFILSVYLCFALIFLKGCAEPNEDKQALLDFIHSIHHSRSINWDANTPVCTSWTGVTCNGDQTMVVALRLPGVGFAGSLPPNTVSRLSGLQVLSLRANSISGPFPSDLLKLKNLTGLYLESNKFSGPLPEDFSMLENISILNLSNNHFNGSIPSSIVNVSHLFSLDLSDNLLSGQIPDTNLTSLQFLDLSNNNLTGFLPKSFQRFPSSAFSGNNIWSETQTPSSSPVASPTKAVHKRSRLSESAILGIVVGGGLLGFIAIAMCMLLCCSNKEGVNLYRKRSVTNEKPSTDRISQIQEHNNGRVTFFEGSNLVFDLEDLLRASAEVLGKGSFGTTYKAALEDSTTVAVKRLKEVSVGKRDFEHQMETVGRIKHENVAALRAFYYSKDEKLMVYDYFILGSVSTLLHGKQGENRSPLDWDTRLRIAIGGARGIAHIHTKNAWKLVHGNIKASNIFLNSQLYGCVSDVGLTTIVTPLTPTVLRSAGYRAPEIVDPRKATQASDVYSFGVFLLELLTGKSPLGEGMNLVKWVNSVVREEWTAEVFDVELLRYPNVEEEMVQMLQLGIVCTTRVPDKRPKMEDVVRMVEDIRHTRSGGSTAGSTPNMVHIGSTSAASLN